MQTKVNCSEVEKAFSLLFPGDCQGWLELRCVGPDRSGLIVRKWFRWCGKENVSRAVTEYLEGQGISGKANVYVGRALRDEEGGGAARDVSSVQSVTLDIDPVRKDPTKPASNEEYDACASAAVVVADLVRARYDARALAVRSGNGTQLWYSLSRQVDVRGRRRWWESGQRAFEAICREVLPAGFKMDTQWDLPRVIKLPGTLSVKGNPDFDHPHRMATVAHIYPGWSTLDPAHIMELAGNELDKEAVPYEGLSASKTVPSRFWIDLNRHPRLQKAWGGTLADIPDKSPSAQDMALACILAGLRYTPEQALCILAQSPGGTPEKRNREDYLKLTIQKAYSH